MFRETLLAGSSISASEPRRERMPKITKTIWECDLCGDSKEDEKPPNGWSVFTVIVAGCGMDRMEKVLCKYCVEEAISNQVGVMTKG